MARAEQLMPSKATLEFPGDLTGAVGDSATVIPVVVALAALSDVAIAPVLLWFGVFQVAWGAHYGVPVSVEPMKALAALVIAGTLTATGLAAAGLLVGGALLFVGELGLLARLDDAIGQPVVRGVQLAVALVLGETALSLGTTNLELAGVALAVALLAAAVAPRASALAVVVVGIAIGFVENGGLSPALPTLTVTLPSTAEFASPETLQASAGQLAMSVGNAAVATALLLNEYFEADTSPDDLASSMGVMNLLAVPLGAIPMCHGSGGVAGKYAFGARTAAANALLGVGYVLAAVFAAGVVAAFPLAMLGVVLVVVAGQLGVTSLETDNHALTLLVGVLGLAAGIGVAFVVGVLVEYLWRRLIA